LQADPPNLAAAVPVPASQHLTVQVLRRPVESTLGGHAFVQNVRSGHYELAVDEPAGRRLAVAFGELALAI
jgi:hypothetical protein